VCDDPERFTEALNTWMVWDLVLCIPCFIGIVMALMNIKRMPIFASLVALYFAYNMFGALYGYLQFGFDDRMSVYTQWFGLGVFSCLTTIFFLAVYCFVILVSFMRQRQPSIPAR